MNEFIDNSLAEESEDEVYDEQQQEKLQEEQSQEEHYYSLQEEEQSLPNEETNLLKSTNFVENCLQEEEEEWKEKEHVLNVHQTQNEFTNEEKYDNTNDTMHPLQASDVNFMAEYDADKRESDYNSLTVLISTLEEELARTDCKNAKELQEHIEQNKNLRLRMEKLLYKRLTDLHSGVIEKGTKQLLEKINNEEWYEEELSEFVNGFVLLESAYRMRLNEEEEDEYFHLLGQTSQEIMEKAHFKQEQYKKLIHYIQAGKERAIRETTQPLTQFVSEFLTNKIAELLRLENEFNNTLTASNHKAVETKEEIETILQEHVLSSWSNSREDENHLFVVLAERLEQELHVNMELRQIHHNMRRELQELSTVTNTFNNKIEKYYTALLEEIMFSVNTKNGKRTRAGMPITQDSHVSNVPFAKNTLNSVRTPFHDDAALTITNNNTDNIYINNTRHECDVQVELISEEIQLLSTQVQHDIETLQRMIMYARHAQMSTEQEREREENTLLLLSITYRWLQYEVYAWRRRVEWQRAHWQHSDVSFATLLYNCNHKQNFNSGTDNSNTNEKSEISKVDVSESLSETNTSIYNYNYTMLNKFINYYRQLTNFVVELHEKVIGTLSHETQTACKIIDTTNNHCEVNNFIGKVNRKNCVNNKCEWNKPSLNLLTPFAIEESNNINVSHTQPIKWFHIPSLLLLQGVIELQDVCLHSVAQVNAAYRKNAHWCSLIKFFALQTIGKSELNELEDVQLHEQLRSSLSSLGITPSTDQLNTFCDLAPENTSRLELSSLLSTCNEYAAYVLLSRTWRNNYITNMQRKFANVLSSYTSMLQNKCHALAELRVLLLQLVQKREEAYGNTLLMSTNNNMNNKENTLKSKLIPLPKLEQQLTWPIILHDNTDINDSMEGLIIDAVHVEQERINKASNSFLHSVNVAVTEEHENTIKKLMWIEQHPQGQMLLKLRDLLNLNHTLRSKLEQKMPTSAVNTIITSFSSVDADEDVNEGEVVVMNKVESGNEHNNANEEEEQDSKNLLFDEKNTSADEVEEEVEEEKIINAKIAKLEELISHEKHHSEELEHKIAALEEKVVV